VISKKFGDRILTASDTAFYDSRNGSTELIPGLLKSVVLDLHTTVSFAGSVERSLDVIRIAREMALSGSHLLEMLELLAEETSNDSCEFLVSSHAQGAELRKLARGHISESLALQLQFLLEMDVACFGLVGAPPE
jgi:hypothetical protein